ncbi:MAG: NAD(P)H-hydrate dehydratase [Acidobacteriia bacterium]|nr:NAD(P)H-hydrate dehydratase [Terriglobia bacterium]
MKIVTAAEMREIDRLTTEQYGVPSLTLMENAGTAVAEFAQKHFDFNYVCVVCGKGNNGGDGLVAARKLQEAGKKVAVIILAKSSDELRGDAAEVFKTLPMKPLWVAEESDFERPEVQSELKSELILDAIVGTGFKSPLQGLGRKAVEVINQAASPVLAIDIPSGAYSDSFLPARAQGLMAKADAVVTFTAPKPVHVFGDLTSGPIAVVSIGTEWKIVEQVAVSLKLHATFSGHVTSFFLPREVDAHKGNFGHILVIGGSVGKAGAAAMAGLAALRTGAGLVTVASPKSVQPTVASFAPEFMTDALPETSEGTVCSQALSQLKKLAEGKDVIVLGPGLSHNSETADTIRQLLPELSTPVVLDADGLNAFEGHTDQLRNESGLILTPHPGEMARIAGSPVGEGAESRLKVVREIAHRHDAIVVLKGHRTLTASKNGQVWVNTSGNPGMAKGGSGDVLSGIIAATLLFRMNDRGFMLGSQSEEVKELLRRRDAGDQDAQQAIDEFSANAIYGWVATIVSSAVYLHGLAGDIARDLYGENSMIATDMINCLGEAFDVCEHEAHGKFAYLQR